MATEVATLVARLEADVRKFDRDIRKAERRLDDLDGTTGKASRSQRKLTDRMKGTGVVMGAVFAGAAAAATIKFLKDSVTAASNLQESMNALEKVYGAHADGLKDIGETASDAFGLSQRAFNEFAVRFSAFGKQIAEGTGRDVIDVVEEMTQRVADFASVHNLSLEEAARVAQSTLAGETEVFRRFGGDVSAAAVNAKALELGLAGVASEITEQDKIMARYALFMEQTSNTAGDFADTSDDLANATRRLAAAWEDAQAEVGKAFIPAIEKALPLLIDLAKWVGDNAVNLGEFLGAIEAVDAALIRYGIRTGGALDTTTALANAAGDIADDYMRWDFWTGILDAGTETLNQRMGDLVGTFEGGSAEIRDLLDNFELWALILGLNEEAAEALEHALRVGLNEALEEEQRAALGAAAETERAAAAAESLKEAASADRKFFNFAGAVDELGDASGRAAETTQAVAEAIRDVARAQRETADPIFAAASAVERLADAEEALTEAMKKGKQREIDRATLARQEAFLDAEVALADLLAERPFNAVVAISEGLEGGVDAAIDLLHRMGLLTDAEWEMFVNMRLAVSDADRAMIQGALASARFQLDIPVDAPELGIPDPPPLTPPPIPEGVSTFAHGGSINGMGIVGEQGPELFVGRGQIHSNDSLQNLGNTFNITIEAISSDPADMARQFVRVVDDELDRLRNEVV